MGGKRLVQAGLCKQQATANGHTATKRGGLGTPGEEWEASGAGHVRAAGGSGGNGLAREGAFGAAGQPQKPAGGVWTPAGAGRGSRESGIL